jgi:small subunit ribosomal protein S1
MSESENPMAPEAQASEATTPSAAPTNPETAIVEPAESPSAIEESAAPEPVEAAVAAEPSPSESAEEPAASEAVESAEKPAAPEAVESAEELAVAEASEEAGEAETAESAAQGAEAIASQPAEAAGESAESAESGQDGVPAEPGSSVEGAVKGRKGAAKDKESAGESTEGAARKSGAKKRRRKPRTTRGARSEEYVAPSPEDLAGIVSDVVREAVEKGVPVGGKVIGWNQGGFHVVVSGISAFCPRSSMELGAPHEPAQYVDQEYLFRVLRVEEKGHRLVLSRTAVLLEERRHRVEEAKKKRQPGVVLKGKVVSLVDFGAFVDFDGVEGLIHVSELRRQRVEHPKEVLELGQEVEAKLIKLPGKGERASFSLRALEPDPWREAAEQWTAGGKFTGKVVRKAEFGWFVELAPGVEGLLHPSQLPPGMKPDDPTLAVGAEIEGWIRDIESKRHRISLALREVPSGDPWRGVEKRYEEDAVVTGTVERIAPFGAFVELEPGLTGLLPTSEMGLPRGAQIAKAFPIGREVKLKVSEVDGRRRRISLTRAEKALEGSKTDYRDYVRKSRQSDAMGTLAAAFERLKSPNS